MRPRLFFSGSPRQINAGDPLIPWQLASATGTDTSFEDEVRHPEHAGRNPTAPDDPGDPEREAEAPKTTRRQEQVRL